LTEESEQSFSMPASTTVEQLQEVFRGREGQLVTSAQVKELMQREYGRNPTSVIPTDYCYNRLNAGINFDKHLFVRISRSEFKYVGPSYPYSGLVFWQPKGSGLERIVGEWKDGVLELFDGLDTQPTPEEACHKPLPEPAEDVPTTSGIAVLSLAQIQRLYEEYCAILKLEVDVFGLMATEVRHLIGRIGEFKCALLTKGSLANEVNQHGFDVVAEGRRISVKTTAQRRGFVSINGCTSHKADDLMVFQFKSGEFELVYHGPMTRALEIARPYEGRFELDITKAGHLQNS
jgi:hypothetical protein